MKISSHNVSTEWISMHVFDVNSCQLFRLIVWMGNSRRWCAATSHVSRQIVTLCSPTRDSVVRHHHDHHHEHPHPTRKPTTQCSFQCPQVASRLSHSSKSWNHNICHSTAHSTQHQAVWCWSAVCASYCEWVMACYVMLWFGMLRYVTSYYSMLYYVTLYHITECCVSNVMVLYESLHSGCRADSSDTWLLRGMMKGRFSCYLHTKNVTLWLMLFIPLDHV